MDRTTVPKKIFYTFNVLSFYCYYESVMVNLNWPFDFYYLLFFYPKSKWNHTVFLNDKTNSIKMCNIEHLYKIKLLHINSHPLKSKPVAGNKRPWTSPWVLVNPSSRNVKKMGYMQTTKSRPPSQTVWPCRKENNERQPSYLWHKSFSGKLGQEMKWMVWVLFAVMRVLLLSLVVKKELSRKPKLLI